MKTGKPMLEREGLDSRLGTIERRTLIERRWASMLIRSEMLKQGITYGDLAKRLSLIGLTDDERNLRNKVSRGNYSVIFLFQCLAVMGVRWVENNYVAEVLGLRPEWALKNTLENLSEGAEFEDAIVRVEEAPSERETLLRDRD